MGSTTTDVVPLVGGRIAARGYTDAQRLAAGELVYTGLVRGFVMATADRAPLAGSWTTLVNENFATMADVHRILGSLPDGADLMATADGREKTVAASRARLARMVGADAADLDDAAILALARWFAEAQLRAIVDAAMLAASATALPVDAPVVGAGIGTALVARSGPPAAPPLCGVRRPDRRYARGPRRRGALRAGRRARPARAAADRRLEQASVIN